MNRFQFFCSLLRRDRDHRVASGARFAAALLLAAAASVPAAADPLVRDTLLDASFGVDGRRVVPIDLRPGNDIAERAVADGQGGVWIVGRAAIAGGTPTQRYVLAAARLDRSGSIAALAVRQEIAFWRDITYPVYEVQSIAADAAGRLLLSVIVCTTAAQESCTSRLLRIAQDGSPDATFDGDGELREVAMQRYYGAITAGPDGQVWASGYAPSTGVDLYRFDAAGALLGTVAMQNSYEAFAPIGGNRWLALMDAPGAAAAVVRLSAEGVVDREFGVGGTVLVPEPADDCGLGNASYDGAALSATPDGRALVLVHLSTLNDPVLSLVAGVGAGSEAAAPTCIAHLNPEYVGLTGSATGAALREDGRAFVSLPHLTGAPGTGMGLVAYRLAADGALTLDAGFNGGAPWAVRFPAASGASDAYAAAVVLDLGAPIVVGSARIDGAGYDYVAARTLGSTRVFRGSFE